MSKACSSALATIVGLALIVTAACSKRAPNHQDATSDTPKATATEATASANEGDEAVRLVKKMIDQKGGLTASLSLPFSVTSIQTVTCSPQEAEMDQSANPHNPELWHCRSYTGGPPFQKRVTSTTTQCCKTQTATVRSGDISNWRAEDAGDDQQKVSADYAVLGQTHHSAWIVENKTQTVGPQDNN